MSDTLTESSLKAKAIELGATVVGFCEIGDLIDRFHPEIREAVRSLPYAVSIGIDLRKAVMRSIVDRPTEIYKFHYQTINTRLNDITWQLAQVIAEDGYEAMAIPASKILQRYPMIAHLNHREIAFKSGLGWRGNNNLLISDTYGSRLRLATLLTDFKLTPAQVSNLNCGKCRACARRCPVEAIGNSPDEFDLEKCHRQVASFARENNFGHFICGMCLTSCPKNKNRRT